MRPADTTPGPESSDDLSDRARRMRTAGSHEERSKAASEMGTVGGEHSQHDDDDEAAE
jgi:hypothetical protein